MLELLHIENIAVIELADIAFRPGFNALTGETGAGNRHIIEYRLQLDSNPEFTASVITAYARAAYRLSREGQTGCRTVLDIAPAYLSAQDGAELRKHLL